MKKKQDRINIWNKYGQRCAYCGCKLEYKDMQVDHIQSKFHHEYYSINNVDRVENLNPSCRQCNFYKGGDTIDVFREKIATIHERFNKIFIVKLALKYGILKHVSFDNKFYFERDIK